MPNVGDKYIFQRGKEMPEYISREEVIETIRREVQEQISRIGLHAIHVVDMLMVEDAVMKIPAADVVERSAVEDQCKEWLKVNGFCPTCNRCSDARSDNTTACPLEEHYVLPLDGYCHLYEPKENKNA